MCENPDSDVASGMLFGHLFFEEPELSEEERKAAFDRSIFVENMLFIWIDSGLAVFDRTDD